jgi:hypothetical protein
VGAVNAKRRELTSFEKNLMRALGLENVQQLDEILAAPISQWAADHSEDPDEEYDLADRMYEEADRQWDAGKQRLRSRRNYQKVCALGDHLFRYSI